MTRCVPCRRPLPPWPWLAEVSPKRRRAQRGFSLLEVLVAFSILALSLGVLMQIFSQALRVTAFAEAYAQAIPLAQAKLNAVGHTIPLEEGVHDGSLENGLRWTVQVQPFTSTTWALEDPMLQPFRVTASVITPTARGTRRITLQTVRIETAF